MTQVYTRILTSPPFERSFAHEQSKVMLPELQRPDTNTSHYLDRWFEGKTWDSGRPRSPPSDTKRGLNGVSNTRAGNMYQPRPETTPKPAREQLPPLSSLFAPISHQGRPAQSPYPESHSPVFPLPSPVDTRKPATPLHPPERSYDASYFQRRPVSRGYSYDSRPEQAERLGIPPPPPPRAPPGSEQESPRYNGYVLDSSRVQTAPTSVNGWSPRSQSNRAELYSRDTSSSFRTRSELQLSSAQRQQEFNSRPVYREISHNSNVVSSYPPTPSSTLASDSVTKDGLGPKIWTGSQFLPRFVRQADVPGEGMCYFYDDGTHCKTVIDGEVVNAHWGVTKAGKPRKRLAIACITCREKKIKCDPDYPRCVQCEKFGRICKFKNAPRGGQGSPDTPPADPEDPVSRPPSSRAEAESFKVEKREISHSVSPRQPLHTTPDSELHHAKRQRTGYAGFSPIASEGSPRLSVQGPASPATPWTEPLNNMLLDQSNVIREWHTNPFQTNPQLVTELVSVLFKHVPETAYCIFPEAPFRAWILSPSEKSLDDLMLIYTLLALATVFSLQAEHKSFGPQFAAISRYTCNNRKFSLQLVQSRLFLALYFFATNNPIESWDYCGGAMRAASGLRLNVEIEKSEDAYLKTYPYGLNRAGFAECRRRTFWSCFLMDRFNGFCSGHTSIFYPEDVFLRLPCDVNSFEAQADVQNPFFDPTNSAIHNTNWTIGSMGYLINISTIWGDVMANIYRSSQRPGPSPSPSTFPAFYENITRRLRAWSESLPSCYTFSAENLMRASSNGMLSTFITMHSVYHLTAMKLNRYIQHSTLTPSQLTHHLSVARHHAETLLVLMDTLAARRPTEPAGQEGRPGNFSSPFAGYAIVSAIDILTAKLPIESIPSRLATFNGSESVLAELALFWQSSKNQKALVAQRIRDLAEISATSREQQGSAPAIGYKFSGLGGIGREGSWEMRHAIETTFGRGYDCVYA